MNLTSDTLAILKNFSEINGNILFKPGTPLRTVSEMRNVVAEATISEKFDTEFGIHDLPHFLRTYELLEKPSIKMNGGGYMTILDEKTKQTINYTFADKSIITTPSKTVALPDKYVAFTIKRDDFAKIQKAALTIDLPDVAVIGDGKTITFTAKDKKNKSSNKYSLVIGETNKTFTAYFKADNFKIIPDDYDVSISKMKASHFINRSKPIQYWIALEPDSTFN